MWGASIPWRDLGAPEAQPLPCLLPSGFQTLGPIVPLSSKPQAFVNKGEPLSLAPLCTAEFRGLFQEKERNRETPGPEDRAAFLLSLGGTLEMSVPAREGAECCDTCLLFTCPVSA